MCGQILQRKWWWKSKLDTFQLGWSWSYNILRRWSNHYLWLRKGVSVQLIYQLLRLDVFHYHVLITLITYTYSFSRAQKRLVNSQKYGVDLVRFTHAKNAAIHASTKRDDAIRYLSLHDNKVIMSFEDWLSEVENNL